MTLQSKALTTDSTASITGIIILHPLLFPLFKELGLMMDTQFKDEAAQRKAFAVLHYIVFEKENVAEPLLAFLKLLCAFEPSVVIQHTEDLSIEEINIVQECLDAFIKHWKTLKQTSIQSLRTAFFQRQGEFIIAQDMLRINCAYSPFDILLDQYPWNLGVIKLPWIQPLIYVSFG